MNPIKKDLFFHISEVLRFFKEITKFIASILTILSLLGVGNIILGVINETRAITYLGIGILILSVIFWIASGKINKGNCQNTENTNTSHFNIDYPPPQNKEVRLDLKEITYEYEPDKQTMFLYKRFILTALRNGIESFPDRYKWTGTGVCSVQSISPGFWVKNQRKEEFWDYFDVQFPYPLKNGEKVEFVIKWSLFDEECCAQPFLSTMIDFPTEHLLMKVKLPKQLVPKVAYAYEFYDYIDRLPICTKKIEWKEYNQSLEYEVKKPKYSHKYMIRWVN